MKYANLGHTGLKVSQDWDVTEAVKQVAASGAPRLAAFLLGVRSGARPHGRVA